MFRSLPFAILLATTVSAQDVFVPPVLKGVKGEGVGRRAEKPIPFPATDEQWLLARSNHFTLISSANEKRTREIAGDLETLAAALAQLTPKFSTASPAPTRVFLFSRRREVQPYFDMLLNRRQANVTGLFVSQKETASMIISVGSNARDTTPYHELVHNLIANAGSHPPLWLEEGVAEYFGNADFGKGSIRAGDPIRPHVDALRRGVRLPLINLFAVGRESDIYNLPAGQQLFYAESWAMVDWMIRTDRGAFDAFFQDVDNGAAVEAALRNHYGKSIEQVEQTLNRYSSSRPQFAMTIAVPTTDASVTLSPLDRASLLYELGAFLAGIEDLSAEAERHFREALVANPAHARSIAALGLLRANDKRYDEATPYFERALAADPHDADIYLDYAEALLRNQIGVFAETEETTFDDASRFQKARVLAEKALTLRGDQGRALGAIGTSDLVESDLTPGIAALEKARKLLPGRMDLTLHLFAMYRRVGDRANADPLFALLDGARSPQVAYAARAIIMRVEMSRVNTLAKQQKLDEAAAVLRGLAAETSDSDARTDLVKQAVEIERVARTNREIEVYNQAIGQVNRGDYAAALKTLNQLLAAATDPSVIRDAKKLQKMVNGRKKS
ncbi:MAG TPA: tetratricopeptide repeat protein [Thermoanaerobaculia bacterium]